MAAWNAPKLTPDPVAVKSTVLGCEMFSSYTPTASGDATLTAQVQRTATSADSNARQDLRPICFPSDVPSGPIREGGKSTARGAGGKQIRPYHLIGVVPLGIVLRTF